VSENVAVFHLFGVVIALELRIRLLIVCLGWRDNVTSCARENLRVYLSSPGAMVFHTPPLPSLKKKYLVTHIRQLESTSVYGNKIYIEFWNNT